MRHKFFNDNFNKKMSKNTNAKFDAFSKQNGSFIFPQKRGAQCERINNKTIIRLRI